MFRFPAQALVLALAALALGAPLAEAKPLANNQLEVKWVKID